MSQHPSWTCQMPTKTSKTFNYLHLHTYQAGQFEKISSWPASTTAHFMFGQLGVGIMTSLPSPCSKREWKTAVTSKICPSTKAQLAGESKKKTAYLWCIFWESKGHWLLELSCPSSWMSSIHYIGMCVCVCAYSSKLKSRFHPAIANNHALGINSYLVLLPGTLATLLETLVDSHTTKAWKLDS